MIRFRTADFDDYTAIAKLHADSWKKTYRGILSDAYLETEVEQDRADTWHQRLLHPASNQHIILAIEDDKVVGFTCIYLDHDPDFGTLVDNLHVASGGQKTGLGRNLLKKAAQLIQQKATHSSVYLWVFELNENARQFYDRIGGKNHETINEKSFDGSNASVCRYVWKDVSTLS